MPKKYNDTPITSNGGGGWHRCNRLCLDEKKLPYAARFFEKKCMTCLIAYDTENLRCYCCKGKLKIRKVGSEARHKRMNEIVRI